MTPRQQKLRLGGLALANGVLIIGPRSWACATLGEDGQVTCVGEHRGGQARRLGAVPLVRGTAGLADMLLLLPRIRQRAPGLRFAFEERLALAAMLGSGIASRLVRQRLTAGATREAVLVGVSAASTLLVTRPGEVASWHGAEHKAVAGYEQGLPATEASRIHPRCGTMLLAPMLLLGAVGTVIGQRLGRSQHQSELVGSLLGVGIATELVRRVARGRSTPVDRATRRVGYALQEHVTTREPSAVQLAAARQAVDRVVALEAAVARRG